MNYNTIKIFNKKLNYYFLLNIYDNLSCEGYYDDGRFFGDVLFVETNRIFILWKHSHKKCVKEYVKSDKDYYVHNENSILPEEWNPATYRILNQDLCKMNDSELLQHYLNHGIHENRIFFNALLQIDDEPNIYKNFTPVFINHDISLTGAPIFLYDLVSYLKNNNIFKNLIILEPFPNNLFDNYDIDKYYHFNNIEKMYQILKNINPCFIYSNSINLFFYNIEHFKTFLPKTIFHFHESIENIPKNQLKIIQNNIIYVVAEKIKQDLMLAGCSDVRLFPPFLPETKILNLDYCRQHGSKTLYIKNEQRRLDNNKKIVGMSGTICKRKGFRLFYRLAQKNPDKEFIWIGGESDWKKNAEAAYGLAFSDLENFFHIPHQKNPYVFFNLLDYFVLTSLDDPCPIVVLEALRLNKKIISLKDKIFYDHGSCNNSISIDCKNKKESETIEEISNIIDRDTISDQSNTVGIDYIGNNFTLPKILKTPGNLNNSNKILLFTFYVKDTTSNKEIDFWINELNLFNIKHNLQFRVICTVHYDQNRNNTEICDRINNQFNSILNLEKIFILENIGWNFYGFMYGIKYVFEMITDPSRCTLAYAHNKSNIYWRDLIVKVFSATINDIEEYDTVVSDDFFVDCTESDLNRPLMRQYALFKDAANIDFKFAGGVFFITKLHNLSTLNKNYDYIISNLTTEQTINSYWIEKMSDFDLFNEYYIWYKNNLYNEPIDIESHEIVKNGLANNYFHLYNKFGKRGIPDMHFEHGLERYIGYLISHNKKVKTI